MRDALCVSAVEFSCEERQASRTCVWSVLCCDSVILLGGGDECDFRIGIFCLEVLPFIALIVFSFYRLVFFVFFVSQFIHACCYLFATLAVCNDL